MRKRLFRGALILAAAVTTMIGGAGGIAQAGQTVASCNTVVTFDVTLQNDLVCADTDGLIVGADNISINLNGHRIACTGPGYKGSCQGVAGGGLADPEPEIGIDTNGHSNVLVTNNDPKAEGVITGFDIGVRVLRGVNVNVKNLLVTAPSGSPRPNPRPISVGIQVREVRCVDPKVRETIVRVGFGKDGNDVSNHTEGIELFNSSCVNVGHNFVHDNNSDPFECHGIVLTNSSLNNVQGNIVTRNGENLAFDGGITVRGMSTGNTLTENDVNANDGDGISTRAGASGNQIVNNVMLGNGIPGVFFDAAGTPRGSGVNNWNENNRCVTQSVPEPPPGVCGPDEATPATTDTSVRIETPVGFFTD